MSGLITNPVNVGHEPIRLYTIYAPPEHKHGTVHPTKAIAEMEEGH